VTAVSVEISLTGDDADETDRLTRRFRQELLDLDVDTVSLAGEDDAPPGAKGDAVTTGTLIVTLANSAVLTSIFQLARTWVTRDRGRRIIIRDGERSVEVHGGSAAEHQQVIKAFLTSMKQVG
jgi:hypothetical protein